MSGQEGFRHDQAQAEKAAQIWTDDSVQNIYCNDFILSFTSADVVMVLLCNKKPVGVLNLSHVLAKTLTSKLTPALESLAEASGSKILTVDEMLEAVMATRAAADKDASDE